MRNKKGWIRIVESFIAVLLIAGVLLIIIEEQHIVNPNPNSDIYNSQLIALRDIQMNQSLRQSVLDTIPPVESDDGGFPGEVKDRMEYLTQEYLACKSKICEIGTNCNLDTSLEKSIYVQSIIVTSTLTTYNPQQLKLFCWRK